MFHTVFKNHFIVYFELFSFLVFIHSIYNERRLYELALGSAQSESYNQINLLIGEEEELKTNFF